MDKFTINLNSPIYGARPINVEDEFIEEEGELVFTFDKSGDATLVNVGDTIILKRYIADTDGTDYTISNSLVVNSKDGKKIYTDIISPRRFSFASILKDDAYSYINESAKTEDGKVVLKTYCRLYLNEEHNIFPQDVECGQVIYFKNENDDILASASTVFVPSRWGDRISTIDDCITYNGIDKGCKESRSVYRYDFLSEKISRTDLMISGISEGDMESIFSEISYIEPKFNSTYHYYIKYDENGNVEEKDIYGNPIKRCSFYDDVWWPRVKALITKDKTYINCGQTHTQIVLNDSFWKIGVGLTSNSNETELGMDDNIGKKLTDEIKESLGDFIDMERLQYSPMVFNNNSSALTIATSITFDFHFRQRALSEEIPNSGNTDLTQNYTYKDGWFIDSNSAITTWWNGYISKEDDTTLNSNIRNFMEVSGKTSDLLGYLNFIDDDVYYRKKKVSQSFIRLAFYSSQDPVEQKLLFYSTVFLDGTGLYGKYVKQLLLSEELNGDIRLAYSGNEYSVINFMENNDTSGRVDSKIVVTNEYDRTKSSEGFNLYLFASDSEIKDDYENPYRTIYMKVEFNHAGNGKTIPMIMWPKDEQGNYKSITIDNYLKSLYIPVKIGYFNNKFVYFIEGAENDVENNNIELILFEPKIDNLDEDEAKQHSPTYSVALNGDSKKTNKRKRKQKS